MGKDTISIIDEQVEKFSGAEIQEPVIQAAQTVHPAVEATIDREIGAFQRLIEKEKRIPVFIPIDPLNKHLTHIPVCINGAVFYVPRGKQVNVPESVAKTLANSDYMPTYVPPDLPAGVNPPKEFGELEL